MTVMIVVDENIFGDFGHHSGFPASVVTLTLLYRGKARKCQVPKMQPGSELASCGLLQVHCQGCKSHTLSFGSSTAPTLVSGESEH